MKKHSKKLVRKDKDNKIKRPKCSIGIMVNKPFGNGTILPTIPYIKVK